MSKTSKNGNKAAKTGSSGNASAKGNRGLTILAGVLLVVIVGLILAAAFIPVRLKAELTTSLLYPHETVDAEDFKVETASFLGLRKEVTDYQLSVSGDQATISYQNKSVTVSLPFAPITSLEAEYQGKVNQGEAFDFSRFSLKVTYADGASHEFTEEELKGLPDYLNEQSFTVAVPGVGEAECELEFNSIAEVLVQGDPVFPAYGETPDVDFLIRYADGTEMTPEEGSMAFAEELVLKEEGVFTADVQYHENTYPVAYEVKARSIIAATPDVATGFSGETVAFTTLHLVFGDGSEADVSVTDPEMSEQPDRMQVLEYGQNIFAFTYRGATGTFTVEAVDRPIVSAEFTSTETQYEGLPLKEGTLVITHENGMKTELNSKEVSLLEGMDLLKAGDNTIRFRYHGQEGSFVVKAEAKRIVKAEVSGEFEEGDWLGNQDMVITFNNGKRVNCTTSDISLEESPFMKVGENTYHFWYDGCEGTFTVTAERRGALEPTYDPAVGIVIGAED